MASASVASARSGSVSFRSCRTARATAALLLAPPWVSERFTVAGGYS